VAVPLLVLSKMVLDMTVSLLAIEFEFRRILILCLQVSCHSSLVNLYRFVSFRKHSPATSVGENEI
jgi:hypothetical protein